jgi:cbb3-type cytochrome oxidase subunit 3
LLRQKSNQKRRTRRAAFLFLFFVAAISAAYRAARKLAFTFN